MPVALVTSCSWRACDGRDEAGEGGCAYLQP